MEGNIRLNRTDRNALSKAADDLSRELKQLGLPLRFKRNAEPERTAPVDGWWITLADWKGRPSVGISLDHSLGFDTPTIWTGFWSPTSRAKQIVDLNEGLPEGLRSGVTLTDESEETEWTILKHPTRRSLRRPFMEHYAKDDSYLGMYYEGGTSAFDFIRAAAFVQGVIYAVEPAARAAKPSASPARRAYLKYAKSFEVKISPLHHLLQKRFEDYLRRSGKEEIAPNLGGGDLRYRDGDDLVLCEVKPCSPDMLRFAIRTAMGQLLDYRQTAKGVRMEIVLSDRPTSRDLDLAISNGFSVAFPSGPAFHIEPPRRA
jgi:hypothetical protein